MSKVVVRYFFDFLHGQENWLNAMAQKGYRLKKCGSLSYTFEECTPDEYKYAVEYVGADGYSQAREYREYLESMGLRAFTKNINLNFSFGKVRWRPYASGSGQLATSPGGINSELLILEKINDGTPFRLHTDVGDRLAAYRTVKRAYLWVALLLAAATAATFIPGAGFGSAVQAWAVRGVLAALCALFTVPAVRYSGLVKALKNESRAYE